MKRIFLFLLCSFSLFNAKAQEVIKWEFNYNIKTKQVEIVANIDEGWHLYSQFIQNDVGPVPTTITFKSSDDFQLVGAVAEPKPIQKYDENLRRCSTFSNTR